MTAPAPAGPTDAQGELREDAAKLLYPGLFPDEAYRRHSLQIDRVAAALAAGRRDALAAQETVRRASELCDAPGYELAPRQLLDAIRRALAGES